MVLFNCLEYWVICLSHVTSRYQTLVLSSFCSAAFSLASRCSLTSPSQSVPPMTQTCCLPKEEVSAHRGADPSVLQFHACSVAVVWGWGVASLYWHSYRGFRPSAPLLGHTAALLQKQGRWPISAKCSEMSAWLTVMQYSAEILHIVSRICRVVTGSMHSVLWYHVTAFEWVVMLNWIGLR